MTKVVTTTSYRLHVPKEESFADACKVMGNSPTEVYNQNKPDNIMFPIFGLFVCQLFQDIERVT
jgi:hypothetical protein